MKVEFDSVTKKYGSRTAVKNISFKLNSGEVIGFVGPNGAGKTTTMKLILGLLFPDEGIIRYDGVLQHEAMPFIRSRFGFLPENNPLPEDTFVADYLEFQARLKGVKNSKDRVKALAKRLDFSEYLVSPVGSLSKGYRQRVGLASAMLSDPEVLVLDEPQEGLDPLQRVEIRELIKEIGREKTVILSTHILSEVAETCRRIILINSGEIMADTSMESFLRKFSQKMFRAVVRGKEADRIVKETFKNYEIEASKKGSDEFELKIWSEKDIREELFHICVKNNLILLELTTEKSTLEDVFLKLTGKKDEREEN